MHGAHVASHGQEERTHSLCVAAPQHVLLQVTLHGADGNHKPSSMRLSANLTAETAHSEVF
jgi:hypothetical protein